MFQLLTLLLLESVVTRLNEPSPPFSPSVPALNASLWTAASTCDTLNLTMCTRPCAEAENSCVNFATPIGRCWNPRALFPNSTATWGTQDILDILSPTGDHVERNLFDSNDSSCSTQVAQSNWTLDVCTGPVSDSHPFGFFQCAVEDGQVGPAALSKGVVSTPEVNQGKPKHVLDFVGHLPWTASPEPIPPENICHFGDPFRTLCEFDELNITMGSVPGAMCAPQCESNLDCERALGLACGQMNNVRAQCSLQVQGMRFCGLFCSEAHNSTSDGGTEFCDSQGLATCQPLPSTPRSLCTYTS